MKSIYNFILKYRKLLLLIIPLCIIIVLLINLFPNNQSSTNESTYNGEEVFYYIDEISGQEFMSINQEPEGSTNDNFVVIGLNTLIDMGYTTKQYDIIYDAIRNYFSNDTNQVNYKKDSFRYDPENNTVAYFNIISPDTKDEFLIKLTSQTRSLTDINVVISAL